ncbi:MAG: aminotransferase class I/II-fold pyridoxal phosphate-dependent enzyme [Pseudomonadota bacterium]
MSVKLEERIRQRLNAARQEGLYRNPPVLDKKSGRFVFLGNQKLLNFASNDYLGLGSSEQVASIVSNAFKRFSASSSSSRLVSGNFLTTCEAEQAYADYFGYDEAVFFSSGYQANSALISTLFEKEDTIIFDKHVHASCVSGLTMSQASLKGYNHSSMDHLEKRLGKIEKQTAVVTESLFSMDGDLLDIQTFGAIKKKYSFFCIVDEAHAFGALGDGGRGIARPVADIALGTFGKAMGLFGAFVLMPKGFKEYLINFASPFIYTTALPEAHAAAALEILDIISFSHDKRAHLNQISSFMKDELIKQGFIVNGQAHILSVTIGDEQLATDLSKALLKQGILSFPARYPTVQKGKAILRISLSALHQQEDVRFFVEKLKKVKQDAC